MTDGVMVVISDLRCVHGYGHHAGSHSCDPWNHADECPVSYADRKNESYASQLLGIPIIPIRETRLAHNHVFQNKNGIEGCPACDAVDPYHMTMRYFAGAYQKMHEAPGW